MAMHLKRRKIATATAALTVVAAMVGASFAAVPLYRLVCKSIGIGGVTKVATAAPKSVSDVMMTVRFDANTDKQLPWTFTPNQKSVDLKLGETRTISYHVKNMSDATTTGTAMFNVTPDKIGQYFNKLACFCFQEQTLAPGQEADLGVTFFVDPDLIKNDTTEEVRTITLSYTFYRSKDGVPLTPDTQSENQPLVNQAGAATTANAN